MKRWGRRKAVERKADSLGRRNEIEAIVMDG